MVLKKRWALVLAMIMIFVLTAGCQMVEINEEKDRKRVIAVVNGEKILKADYIDIYMVELQNNGITSENIDNPEAAEYIIQIQNAILDQLISEVLLNQKAAEAGFVLNDEYRQKAIETFDADIEGIAAEMESMGLRADGTPVDEDEEVDYLEEAKGYIDFSLQTSGETIETYQEALAEDLVIEDYQKDLLADFETTRDEVVAYYEQELEYQQANMEVVHNFTLFQAAGVRVKHILIGMDTNQQNSYNKLQEQDQRDADEYLQQELEEEAMVVLDLAKEGDFEALIIQYGEDPGMVDNDEGYIVYPGSNFVPTFKAASLALEAGEVSDLVPSDFGYHIIKAYEKMEQKTFTIDEVYDDMKATLDGELKYAQFSALMAKWMDEAKVKIYKKRL